MMMKANKQQFPAVLFVMLWEVMTAFGSKSESIHVKANRYLLVALFVMLYIKGVGQCFA